MIRVNYQSFSRQLRDHPLSLRRILRDVLVEFCVVCAEGVVKGNRYGNPTGTPVQTGFARNSWYVEHRTLTVLGVPRPAEGEWDKSGTARTSLLSAEITESAALGVPLYLVNGAVYMIYLEWGRRSRQAPEGIVNLLLPSGQAIMDDIALRLRGRR